MPNHSVCYKSHQEYLVISVLVITDGNEECQQPKGKFHLEFDDCPQMDTVDNLMVNWNEMLETRLLYP